jgi:hypothetical protein
MLRSLDVADDGIIKSGQVNEISILHYTSSHSQTPRQQSTHAANIAKQTVAYRKLKTSTWRLQHSSSAYAAFKYSSASWCSDSLHTVRSPHSTRPFPPITHVNTPAVVDASDVSWVTNQTPSLRNSLAFMLFTSLWTLLAVAYLVISPRRFPAAAHEYAIIAVEFLTMLFWFAAFVAVASNVGTVGYSFWEYTALYKVAVAAVVFSALVWLTFVVTAALAAMHIRRASRDSKAARSMTGV